MKKVLKPLLDSIKNDPREIGVTANKEEKKSFLKDNKKTIQTGGIIAGVTALLFGWLWRRSSKKKRNLHLDEED